MTQSNQRPKCLNVTEPNLTNKKHGKLYERLNTQLQDIESSRYCGLLLERLKPLWKK